MAGNTQKQKTQIDYMQAYTLRDLLAQVNTHNEEYPDSPILKDDIVNIRKEDNIYLLLYYK